MYGPTPSPPPPLQPPRSAPPERLWRRQDEAPFGHFSGQPTTGGPGRRRRRCSSREAREGTYAWQRLCCCSVQVQVLLDFSDQIHDYHCIEGAASSLHVQTAPCRRFELTPRRFVCCPRPLLTYALFTCRRAAPPCTSPSPRGRMSCWRACCRPAAPWTPATMRKTRHFTSLLVRRAGCAAALHNWRSPGDTGA